MILRVKTQCEEIRILEALPIVGQIGEARDWPAEFDGYQRDGLQLLGAGTAEFQS
jgi:hypothetical protein